MGSGVQRIITGAVVGTGAALDVKTVGFRPRKVTLLNETGLAKGEWTNSMADGEMLKTITAGTMSKVTTNGVTPLSNGFTIGADADVNAADELIHYVAEE